MSGRIIIDLFTTLDGVAQAPGGPEEDPSDDFPFGGWQAGYPSRAVGESVTQGMETLDALLRERHRDVHVIGSVDLVHTLLAEQLYDELQLWVYPVVLGRGKKVFPDGASPHNMRLLSARAGDGGALLLRYAPERARCAPAGWGRSRRFMDAFRRFPGIRARAMHPRGAAERLSRAASARSRRPRRRRRSPR